MQTFKPNPADKETLQMAGRLLKGGNQKIAEGNKEVEAAKAIVTNWLGGERNCQLETLAIGEMIEIESCFLVEISKQNKFDEKRFLALNPIEHAAYKKDFPVKKFKALV